MVGFCEEGNERSASIKGKTFHDKIDNCHFLKSILY
jgi:hypothetical protein